jgi:hypothetical protein
MPQPVLRLSSRILEGAHLGTGGQGVIVGVPGA